MTAADGRFYSAAELRDIIAAKDVEIGNTQADYNAIASGWPDTQWPAQWKALLLSYNTQRGSAQRYIAALKLIPLTDLTQFDASAEYTAVLQSLNPNWPGAYGTGSLQDLEARLAAEYTALGQTEAPGAPIPQPAPGDDSGLGPRSWEAYVTGLGYKLGVVPGQDVPPGTPGGPGASDPPLIPTWLKWTLGGGLALYAVNTVTGLIKVVKR